MVQLQKFYDKKTIYKYNSVAGSIHQKAMSFVKNKSSVLDIGCASGYLGKELAKKGCIVYGVEISSVMARKTKNYYKGVMEGNIEKIELPWRDGFFDAILLLDVLEHLFEPDKTLLKLKKFLSANGIVIISLPNIANWWVRWNLMRGIFEYTNEGLLDAGHIRFFTYDSAVKMIQSVGYEIVSTDLVITLPKFLLKLDRIFPISSIAVNYFKKLFGYQFLFVAKIGR